MSSDPAMKSAGLVEALALSANSAHARPAFAFPHPHAPHAPIILCAYVPEPSMTFPLKQSKQVSKYIFEVTRT